MSGPVRVGCSGWQYKDWRGRLYPEGLATSRWLARYAEEFDTVEVNSTFYRLASRDAVARWVAETPDGFLFAAKASRYLTHARRLREIVEGIHRYYERIMPLVEADKLGPLVWQFPATFRREGDALERVAAALERVPPGRHCFEFRHESWFAEEVYALLRQHDAALVIGDHPRWPFQARELTAGWTLVRLHHGRRGRRGNYSETETGRMGPADRPVAPPGRGIRLLQQRLGGLCRGQRPLAQAAAAAVSSRSSARRSRRDTCICE